MIRGILSSVVFVLVLAGCQKEKKPEFLIRASHLVNENHTWHKAFVYFGEILEERSSGRIKLENYHSEQLAKEIEAIRLIQAGVIDITITGSTLSNWTEIATFCELPFLLRDSLDIQNVVNSPIGKKIEQAILQKTNLRTLCYFQRGPRHLTSNRPIQHPDDLNGLIIRVPNVPSFVKAWGSLGAKPTPMAFSEVFTSLQQGTIEAQENPLAMIRNAGFSEVQKYINLTSHVVSWAYPVIGEKQFQALPDDLKDILILAAKDMQIYERQLYLENERKMKNELEKSGMEFIEVNKDAFNEKCKDAIFKSLSPEMQKVYNEIIALKKNEKNHS